MLTLLLRVALGAVENDRVPVMPWATEQMNFNLYSGYLNLTNTGGIQLHYVFAESQNNPQTDPVVLWLNGGPGCSSMDGFLYENGPYYFGEQSTYLVKNPYSWNNRANMLYLESPAGVGFSLYGNSSNLHANDNSTAVHNAQALSLFFSLYPEFLSNEFYISGESYGGIYVPTLAYQVLLNNDLGVQSPPINIKGIIVGNGATDWRYDAWSATTEFAWQHNIVNQTVWEVWNLNGCNAIKLNDNVQTCQWAYGATTDQFNDINIYDIYRTCLNSTSSRLNYGYGVDPESIPCVDSYGIDQYFNNNTVREMFHVNNPAVGAWGVCTTAVFYTIDYAKGSIYAYPTLMERGLRVWFYSGDTDASVPALGTRKWIKELNLETMRTYRQWFLPNDNQVSGYVVDYYGLTFVTVKGTGHMSIQWKRP